MLLVYSTDLANWATGHSLGELYPSAEVLSVYFTAVADWTTRHSMGESYPSAEVLSMYSTALAEWATRHSLGESYPSAEVLSMYSTALAEWATRHSLGESYPSAEVLSVYSTALTDRPEGACGVMEMNIMNRVQILDEAVCISHNANTLGKGTNLTIPLPFKDRQASLTLVWQLVLEKKIR